MTEQQIVQQFEIREIDGRLALFVYGQGDVPVYILVPDKIITWENLLKQLEKHSKPQHFVKQPFGGPLETKTMRSIGMADDMPDFDTTLANQEPDPDTGMTDYERNRQILIEGEKALERKAKGIGSYNGGQVHSPFNTIRRCDYCKALIQTWDEEKHTQSHIDVER